MEGTDEDFELLKREILRDTSLDCSQYRENYLRRRIAVRMRSRGITSFEDYRRVLSCEPVECDSLLDDITVNVTTFFRDPKVFELLEKDILPVTIFNKVRQGRKVIRLWSAGCSSGEEAYSLTILMRDLLGDQFDDFIVSVHATDIDDECLRKAKKGWYFPNQVQNVAPEHLEEYFSFEGDMYRVSKDIREIVRFTKHDLFADKMGSHYDMILCRNVFIYFTKESVYFIFNRLSEVSIYNIFKYIVRI